MEKFTTSLDLGYETQKEEKRKRHNLRVVSKDEEFKPRKKEKAKKTSIAFYFVNILLGAVILAIASFVFIITACKLENVEYEGVVNSNPKKISQALLNDKYCDNAIYAWAINSIKKHEAIPFVNEASVYLKNKNTIVISVKEDNLFGCIDAEGKYIYFDNSGNVNEISKKYIEGVTLVTGLVPSDAKEGESLAVSKTQKSALIKMLKYVKESGTTPDTVIFDEDGTFGFNTGNIFVDLGMSSDIREKCDRLPYILPTIKGETGTLHLEEWGRENSDIIFEKTN